MFLLRNCLQVVLVVERIHLQFVPAKENARIILYLKYQIVQIIMEIENLDIKISKESKYKALLKKCYEYAKKSNHPSTHNAALIVKNGKVILKGTNVLPPGVNNISYRFEEGNRNVYPNHAERDVVYKAAREGIKTKGLTMVMPWLPCIPCANAVITSGIKQLIVHKQMVERTKEKWVDELKEAVKIMKEAGIVIIAYDGLVGVESYMHKEKWDA